MQDYTKEKTIGRGSFGKVCVIKEKSGDQLYAAKIIYRHGLQNYLVHLRREVDILSKFRHPAILRYKGFNKFGFKTKKRPVIVTEYLPNGSLNRILRLQSQHVEVEGWDQTKKLINIYGIAVAMAYLHANNIIHRDLKPDNILLDDHLFPKICDFGLAKVLHRNQQSMTQQTAINFKGTPYYAAPEIILENKFDMPGDVYAFAIIVYQILTNNEPYDEFTPKLMKEICSKNKRPKLDNNIPDCFRELITQCWASDFNIRPTFEKIVDDLKTKEDFRVGVDSIEFQKYIEYIDNPDRLDYNFTKYEIPEPFQEGSNSYKEAFDEDIKTEAFRSLHPEVQKELNDSITVLNGDMSKITFNFNQLTLLHRFKSLDSPVFVNLLEYFDDILMEVMFPSDFFKEILDILSGIKQKVIERMRISITILDSPKTKKIKKDFINNEFINIIKINKGVKSIDPEAFRGCIKLEEIYIPEGVKSIGNSMFRGCANLIKISLPETVTTIGEHALRGAHKLGHITIPSKVTLLEGSVFRGCFNLVEIKMADSKLTVFKKSTFRGCTKLKELTIPNTVTLIEKSSCEKCSTITEIVIPKSVNQIENQAFRGCSSLAKITVDPYTTTIENDAFQECFALTTLEIMTSETALNKIEMKPFFNVKKIIIPSNVTSIDLDAFENCTNLTEIVIPSSVSMISNGTFDGFNSLKEITIDPYSTNIEKDVFVNCPLLEVLNICTSEKVIRPFDLNMFPKVTKIVIPNNVVSIEKNAFKGCSRLNEIMLYIPEKSTTSTKSTSASSSASSFKDNEDCPSNLASIDESAFQDCSSLKELLIPPSVTRVGSKAFSGCSMISKVTYDPYKVEFASDSFENCTNISTLNFETKETVIRLFDKKPFPDVKKINIPLNITLIEANSFENLTGLQDFVIHSSVSEIRSKAFKGCTSLAKIMIDPYQTKIKDDAFEGCESLETLIISTYETAIHSFEMNPFKALKKIMITSNITKIEKSAFENCSSLQEIIIPSSVQEIQNKAFKNCTGLKLVFYNPEHTQIQSDSFENCNQLKTLVILTKKQIVPLIELKPFGNVNKIIIPMNSRIGENDPIQQLSMSIGYDQNLYDSFEDLNDYISPYSSSTNSASSGILLPGYDTRSMGGYSNENMF